MMVSTMITTGGTTTQKTVDGGKRASSLVGSSVEAREGHWFGPVRAYLTTISFLVSVSSPIARR